ncbi:hypothetical protein BCR39DRAFT_590677 [Naematelia encephala]|uniref:C3H1-type domain-containing protein n=1 Tax=Naematelia encephala TaxID=71784 RepID=A0A1Y2AP02_9TREE|nr:hypothetical protein BCR39DRAFT_590677 [Naematelia encephala]
MSSSSAFTPPLGSTGTHDQQGGSLSAQIKSGELHFPSPSTSTSSSLRSPLLDTHSNSHISQDSTNMVHQSPPGSTSVLATHPHLGHYIFNLLNSLQSSPPRPGNQHPLSVSSSGGSEGSDDEPSGLGTGEESETGEDNEQKTPKKKRIVSSGSHRSGVNGMDKDDIVRKVVDLLDKEEEDAVKETLKPFMGDLGKDDILMDQVCLDCMHRRRDDLEGIPYAQHLTPNRARSSPAITSQPLRPYTPTRVPSFRARTPLGRPHSPSPALPSTGTGTSTPTLPHGHSSLGLAAIPPNIGQGTPGPSSPLASPRLLNAKAVDFRPSPRAVSAPLSAVPPGFSPSDPWRDLSPDPPRTASPFSSGGRPISMARTNSSNLAIAAPLFSDQSSPFHSPVGTPHRNTIKMPDVFASPSIHANKPTNRGIVPDDDDDDEFSPFGKGLPKLAHLESSALNTDAKPFEPFTNAGSASIHFGSSSTLSSSMPLSDSSFSGDSATAVAQDQAGQDEGNDLSAGMTPLDVLCSVFTSVPRYELEDALARAGYDFEGAMAFLVSQHTLPRSGSSTPQRVSSPRPMFGVGSRGAVPLNHSGPRDGYFLQGGRSVSGNMSPGWGAGNGGTRSPGGQATRMCRYYLAGECRRSDCRFSHDLDRALCRFWLRGHCAKGPNCEFLHHLPNNLDPGALSNAMSHVQLGTDGSAHGQSNDYGPPDEFPDLLAARLGRTTRFDPSRNRFANAVKRAHPGPISMPSVQITGARFSPSIQQGSYSPGPTESRPPAPAVPRASSRIKLRPPTLVPTIRTGTTTNDQYMAARATAIRLGHARNACLARAADAFRRGDGAAAKRFSREGKSLNERMLNEGAEAALALVRDRRVELQKAVRERDANWSDDPSDRSQRGRDCAGGLGVILGVASSQSVPGSDRLSSDERTECLIDLHTLHGQEGSDVVGQFLAELEREHYRGLAYVLVGEEKHVASQDPLRGASKVRLANSVKNSLAEWGYAWSETGGTICVDPCRF